MENIIETNNLCMSFGQKKALDNVNLHVKKGEIYGFVGENGAGKTTTMKIILGLLEQTSGEVLINGNTNLDSQRKSIGALIEAPGLYLNKTARDNLELFTYLFGGDKEAIPSLLKKVGLDNTNNKKVGQFSLGMKQRLGIAVSLIGNPDILILDEPINGLDPKGILEMRNLFKSLKEEGKTILISSHILTELAKIADRFGIIHNGVLVKEVSSEEISTEQKACIFKVSDVSKGIEILKEANILNKYDVLDDKLRIYYPFDKKNTIKYLINNDVLIESIIDEHIDVENYIVNKMEA
ncbi:MAG: ABC transporter ATP-binding protein [Acholeplasmatales bacterium]|nr:ABC transporter ATP-binding protein [Acholeplasmatales bacterium]